MFKEKWINRVGMETDRVEVWRAGNLHLGAGGVTLGMGLGFPGVERRLPLLHDMRVLFPGERRYEVRSLFPACRISVWAEGRPMTKAGFCKPSCLVFRSRIPISVVATS